MINLVLVVHLLLAIALIAVILMQRSEGGALGIGGGGGLMTGRQAGNLLTRITAILATLFIATSLGLALLAEKPKAPKSLMDAGSAPAAPMIPGLDQPKDSSAPPSVPLAR